MRVLFSPFIKLIIFTSCVTNAFAGEGTHSGIAYVQIGDGKPFQVDLGDQKAIALSRSPQVATWRAEIEDVGYSDATLDSSILISSNGCWRGPGANWAPLPGQMKNSEFMSAKNSRGLVIARGVLIDAERHMFLDGICRGIITQASTKKDILIVARREVTGAFVKQDRVLGLQFSNNEIVARSEAWGASPIDILRFEGRVKALSIDPITGDTLVVREVSKTGVAPTGWIRSLAGHPKQSSTYELVVRGKSAADQKVIKLISGKSGQKAKIWF